MVSVATAHGLNTGYTTIDVTPQALTVTISFNLSDLPTHFPADADGDQQLTPEELSAMVVPLYDFCEASVVVELDGAPAALTRSGHVVRTDASGQEWLDLSWQRPLGGPLEDVALALGTAFFERFGQDHTHLASLRIGGRSEQAVLSISEPVCRFTAGAGRPLPAQLAQFTRLGIAHIFLGYDHLMFLLALLLLGGRWWGLIKIVTAFTVAHTLTLVLAALQVVALPPRLIETGIAFSVAYVAAENLWPASAGAPAKARADHRWVLTFGFGLVHGFGFANVLRELGLPTRGLVSSLLAFNVGVEAGQLAVVSLLFPAILWMAKRPYYRRLVVGLSGLILAFGLGWLAERAFNLSFMPF